MSRKSIIGGFHERAVKMFKGSKDDIGWLQRAPGMPPVQDGTDTFDNLLFDIKRYNQHRLPKSLVYLFVPGLLNDLGPPNFVETQAYFKHLGLDCEVAKVDSAAGILTNAKSIKECIEKIFKRSRKRVVILGHSKGGVDAAAALSIYWSELKDKVAGLVLAQSPYAGNPIASDILCPGLFRHVNLKKEIVEIFMSDILNGDISAIEDLTYEKRREFLRLHPLPRELPVVSFHTETKINSSVQLPRMQGRVKKDLSRDQVNAAGGVKSAISKFLVPWYLPFQTTVLTATLQLRYGEKNDGIVTRKDAEAPGSVAVRPTRYLDHTWIPTSCPSEDPREANNSQVCEALFTLLIDVAQTKGFNIHPY